MASIDCLFMIHPMVDFFREFVLTVRQVIRRATVLETLRLSKSTLQRRIASGTFPPAFHLGERIVVWWVDEVETMLDLYARDLSIEELRAQVQQLVQRRCDVGTKDCKDQNRED